MARASFLRRTVRNVLRGATWFKSVSRYNERFPRMFRADKWRPASEGSLWMNLFGLRSSPLSLVGTRRRGRNNMARLLRVEGLEQKQLLAIDVAVVDGGDNTPFDAIVAQLNDSSKFDFKATLVQPADVATAAQITAGGYEVVLIGNDGGDKANDGFPTLAAGLRDWVENARGGVVAVGWSAFGIRGGTEEADLDAILPMVISGSGETFEGKGSVLTIDQSHPVTDGVNNITVADANFFETVAPPADAWGTVLGTHASGNLGVVAGAVPTGLNPGRSVYLGPDYAGSSTLYDTTQLRSGDADRMLEQAVNWAANNPPPVIIINAGATVAEGGTEVIDSTELNTVDPDTKAANLVYTVTTAPTNALGDTLRLSGAPTTTFTQADINANLVTYVHDGSETTSDSFTFSLTDGTTTISGQNFAITVTPVNDPPVANDQSITTTQDQAKSGKLTATDAESDPLTFALGTQASKGTAVVNPDGTFTYTPNAGFTGSDSFTFTVDDPGPGGPDTGLVSVTVNPAPVTSKVSIAATTQAAEPNLNGEFTVTLSAPSATDTTVTYNASGTAINGTDYKTITGFLSIPAGATSGTIPIVVIDDSLVEGTETVFIALSTASGSPGVAIDPAADEATLNIADNDVAAPTVSVAANDANAAEVASPGTPNPGSFRISLSQQAGTATTVNYTITGTATNGSDYATIASSTVVPANTSFVDIPVNVIDDTLIEGSETVIITLTSTSGTPGATVNTTPATVTIADNDASQVTIVASDPNAAEPSDNGAFTISLSQQSATATTVNLTITGSAINGGDYQTIANSVVIPANTSSVVIPVTVIDDLLNETSESVIITVTGTTNPSVAVGSPSSATVNIADNENDPPVAGDDIFTTPENKTLNVPPPGVLANDVDPDGDPLQAALLSTTSNGTLAFISNGGFTYTPNTNFEGGDSFTYRVFDGQGKFDDAKVTINVTPVNNPPVAVDDKFTTQRSTPVTGNVLVNDSDPDGDAPLFTGLQTPPANGSVVLQSNGTFTYTPNDNIPVPPNKEATDFFEYLLSDGRGGTDTGKVTITITAPTNLDATDDFFTAPEDTVITGNLLANDVDPEGDAPFSLVSNTAPSSGTLITSPNGDFTYAPFANFFGTDKFTYTIQDTKGFTDTATVTLTLTPVNDVEAVNDVFSTKEDTKLTVAAPGVLANDFDPDINKEHQFPITGVIPASGTTSKGGSFSVNADGSFTYTPALDFQGADTFTYTITDSQGATDTATVTINVADIVDAPVAVDDTKTVLEDSVNNFIDVLANDFDPDGDKLFVSAITPPANGTVTIVPGVDDPDPGEGGGILYTPNPNFFGTDTFTYTASDGRGKFDTATVTVTVTDTPDIPSPVDDTFNAIEDQVVTLTEAQLLANDINPDKTATIIALNDSKFHVGGKAVLLVNGPDNIPGTADDRSVRFTPNANFTGPASFDYFISGAKADDPGRVTINFAPVNDPPIVGTDTFTTPQNTPITVTTAQLLANDTDVEGDPLTVVGVSNPQNGTVVFNTATGEITFTPNNNFVSSLGNRASFNYTVSDVRAFTTGLVIINVPAPNAPPVANDELIRTVDEREKDGDNRNVNTRIEFPRAELLANDTDPDGDPVSFVELVSGSAIGGTVSLVGTGGVTVRFDTTVNFVGDASFEYKITDGRGLFDIGKATIRVKDTNDPPDARNDTATTEEDKTVQINVLANDLDADFANPVGAQFDEPTKHPVTNANLPAPEQLRVVSVGAAANGMASLAPGGVISYTPNPNFAGTDSFSYTIADLGADNIAGVNPVTGINDDLSDTATVTVTVTDVPGVDANNDSFKVNEDTIRNPLDVLKNDVDDEGDAFKVTAITQGARGVVEIGPNGANVLYTPDPNFVGIDQFTYTITDATGKMDTAIVTVEVIDVGEAPNAVDDKATVSEDSGPNVINVRANDSDPDNPISGKAPPPSNVPIVAVTQPANGTVQIRAGGLDLVYTPNPNFSGTDTFTYTLRDPDNNEDTATVTVTVLPQPDAPDAVNDLAKVNQGSVNNQLNVLANDTDPDGDPLTVVSVTQPTSGTAAVAADGKSVLYTPNAGFSGSDVFQYTIRDPSGLTDSATVLVTVEPVGPDFAGTAGDDIFLVRLDPTAANIQVFTNATGTGTPAFSRPRGSVNAFSFDTLGGNDRVIIDLANGDPLPSGGIKYEGGDGTDRLELRDIGTASGVFLPSATTAGTGTVTLGTGFINLTGVEPIDVMGFGTFRVATPNANDTLTITSPAVNTAQLAGTSGAVALSPVTFSNVGNFIIDAAAGDAGAGNDTLTVTPGAGRLIPTAVGFMEFRSGTGANTLNLQNGSARLDSTVATGGTLDTTLGAGAELITHRFRQNSLTMGNGSRATVLQAGTQDAVSRLNSLTIGTGATLDINDNAVVLDYTGANPEAAIRQKIIEGRGGIGVGNGRWNGTGITSGAARAANALNPESRSIGYANNGTLPLGPYTVFRGQPVDFTTVLIAFTRTADADLDGLVNDEDATIVGAEYRPGLARTRWDLGDFDYNTFVDDDDATLLGAFFNPGGPPLAAPAPLAAAGEAVFAEIGSGGSGSSSASGVSVSSADLAALADEIFAEDESFANRKTKFGV